MHAIFADANNAAAAAFGGFFIFLLIAGLLYAVVWLYCLINAATRTDFDTSQRLIWILVLLFLHGIGPILYLLLARKST
jgi:hypothetical protein